MEITDIPRRYYRINEDATVISDAMLTHHLQNDIPITTLCGRHNVQRSRVLALSHKVKGYMRKRGKSNVR